jgi:hypothetical protein
MTYPYCLTVSHAFDEFIFDCSDIAIVVVALTLNKLSIKSFHSCNNHMGSSLATLRKNTMTLHNIDTEISTNLTNIIAASIRLSDKEEKEAEETPEAPKPSEGTYQPDDPDEKKQKEAEKAPIMPQPPTPPSRH